MSTDVLEIAKRRLAKLDNERRELEAFIAKYEQLAGEVVAPSCPAAAPAPFTPAPRRRAGVTEHIVAAAMEVIGEKGAPMRLSEIQAALVARGVVIPGRSPRNNLCAKLSADKLRLRTIPGKGWWFTNEPPPAHWDQEDMELVDFRTAEGPEARAAEPSVSNGAVGVYPPTTALRTAGA